MKAAPLGGAIALARVESARRFGEGTDLETVFREVATTNPTPAARREMVAGRRASRRAGRRVAITHGRAGGGQRADHRTLRPGHDDHEDGRDLAAARAAVRQQPHQQELGPGGGGRGRRGLPRWRRYQTYAMAWAAYADAYSPSAWCAPRSRTNPTRTAWCARRRCCYESGNGRLEDFYVPSRSARSRCRI